MSEVASWTYMPSFEADRILERVLAAEGEPVEYNMDPQTNLPPGSTILHISCNTSSIPLIPYLTCRIFDALGISYTAVGGPENCCGAPQWASGDEMRGRQVATLALGAFRRVKPTRVVSTCPDCDLLFEMYRGRQYNFEQTNILKVFYDERAKLQTLMVNKVNKRVVLHTHHRRPEIEKEGERLRSQKREDDALYMKTIVSMIPGIVVLESKAADGLGNHCLINTGRLTGTMQDPITSAMFDDVKRVGADTLVVPYHGCYRQHLRHELTTGIEVVHYLSLLADTIGIEYHDVFKEIRRMDNLELAVMRLLPRAKTFGYSESQLRNALKGKVFEVA